MTSVAREFVLRVPCSVLLLEDTFGVEQCCAVNGVFVFAVELHGGVIVSGWDEQGKAVESEQAFHGVLPFGVGDLEYIAKIDDFICSESKFCAQDAAQAGGIGGFGFVAGFAVACAEFADFIFESWRLLF